MTHLPINTIYPSIQGEGSLAGVPMLILRLQGCDVGCPWCDTKETWHLDENNIVPTLGEAIADRSKYALVEPLDLVDMIESRPDWSSMKWVLVTGGEPLMHNLYDLTHRLRQAGFRSALETSGTELPSGDFDWVCVSPKINMPGHKRLVADTIAVAHEIKFVVGRQNDIDNADAMLREFRARPNVIFSLQPISQSQRATELCQHICMERGWRLSLQLHKYINIP